MNVVQVQPKHIKEAFRLLSKSIIRVEQPDIHLEEDEMQQQAVDEDAMDVEPSAGYWITCAFVLIAAVCHIMSRTSALCMLTYQCFVDVDW